MAEMRLPGLSMRFVYLCNNSPHAAVPVCVQTAYRLHGYRHIRLARLGRHLFLLFSLSANQSSYQLVNNFADSIAMIASSELSQLFSTGGSGPDYHH